MSTIIECASFTSLETIFDFEGLKFRREHAKVMLGQLESGVLTSLHEGSSLNQIKSLEPKEAKSYRKQNK
ncbi:hypothetical protein LguiB_005469 [Lonicera macranthoides]